MVTFFFNAESDLLAASAAISASNAALQAI
jgi:hypothetical protein